jgi:hypothetical protein
MKAMNQRMQRSFNRSLVLSMVRQKTRISRVDLSRTLGLEKSSISAIVNELVENGLLIPTEEGKSSTSGGRRPVFLELNANFCVFLGIELQPGRFQAVVVNLTGQVIARDNGEFASCQLGFDIALSALFKRLDGLIKALGLPLAALGIGMPGQVNPYTGYIKVSVPHCLNDWSITDYPNPWNVPAYLENDANCCAWAQLLQETNHKGGNFISLLMEFQASNPLIQQEAGMAVGMAVVINGEVHYGQDFTVGEFYSSNWRKGNLSQVGIPDHELVTISQDPKLLDRYIEEVLINLIPVMSILAPDRLILCGEAKRCYNRFRELINGPMASSWLAKSEIGQRLYPSEMSEEVVAVGAAGRIIQSLFHSKSLSRNNGLPGLDWGNLLDTYTILKH